MKKKAAVAAIIDNRDNEVIKRYERRDASTWILILEVILRHAFSPLHIFIKSKRGLRIYEITLFYCPEFSILPDDANIIILLILVNTFFIVMGQQESKSCKLFTMLL